MGSLSLRTGARQRAAQKAVRTKRAVGRRAGARKPPGPRPAWIALGPELAPDHHGVPHPLGEELIHDGPVRIQHAATPATPPPRGPPRFRARRTVFGCTPNCWAMSQR
jgi:hypothetical protein